MDTFAKDPDAVLDFAFNWSDWLEDDETISTYDITVSDGITLDSDIEADNVVTVWLSGGEDSRRYNVACKIVTSLARTDERTMRIMVMER